MQLGTLFLTNIHTQDFSCIDEDMPRELKGTKQQIEGIPFLRTGYTLLMISWSCMGFFLKYA